MGAIISRTTAQYEALTAEFRAAYGQTMYDYVIAKRTGSKCGCYLGKVMAFQAALTAIASWQQYSSGYVGDYTNPITLEELTAIINVGQQMMAP
jgi:hypothetical protein